MSESVWPVRCTHCNELSFKPVRDVNRAEAKGAPLYCDRTCAGAARRSNKTLAQKRADKAEYDRARRAALGERLLAKKRAAYHAEVKANPEKVRERERRNRAKRKNAHAEYCRRPEYREWKQSYDRRYRADRIYGPFAQAFLTLRDLETELAGRASKYERYSENGTLNKCQRRKRDYEQATHCRRA